MQNRFITADMILAAVILATVETNLITVKKKENKEVEFVFPKNEVIENLAEVYEEGGIRIEPIGFIMVLKFIVLKARQAK